MNGVAKAVKILDKSIRLHQLHMESPSSATEESQEELMEMLKSARSALAENRGEKIASELAA